MTQDQYQRVSGLLRASRGRGKHILPDGPVNAPKYAKCGSCGQLRIVENNSRSKNFNRCLECFTK